MDLAVVTPQLSGYGGSEIYLLECLKRWQREAQVTVYSPSFNRQLLREFGIDRRVRTIRLSSARSQKSRYSLLDEIVVLPRIWEQQIGRHDLYFLYLFPTQMIRRRPSVWFAAEPLRMLYDLRYHSNRKDQEVQVHFYPKQHYNNIRVSDLDVLLDVIERVDSSVQFDHLVTNSRMTGEYIGNIYGRTPDLVAYPGVHVLENFEPPPTFDRVLYVGRLWRHKRVALVLKAMALTKSPNTLVIAGDGPEKRPLQGLARRLGLSDKVEFRGDVSVSERERLYQECTCCVYTPLREPFGMVPLEAAAAGRPVVATIGGGYTEILNEKSAFFVPAYEGAIAHAIHRLMSNPRRAMTMGRAGTKLVRPYTWDRTAGILMDLFRDVATRPSPSHPRTRSRPRNSRRPQLGAHYYPWYRAGKNPIHWNENSEFSGISDWPTGGAYTSTQRTLIRKHLRMASRAGIDFFIVNWHVDFRGVNPRELEATRRLLQLARDEKHPIKFCILLAVDSEDPKILGDAIRCAKKEFMGHPNYLRHQRRAVLWYLLNDSFRGYLFHHYAELSRLSRGTHPVATGSLAYNKFMPRLLREFFSGWCIYSPLEVGKQANWEMIWSESYRDFDEDGGAMRIFTISPGYDDTHLTSDDRRSNRFRRISRKGLKTYKRMQAAALALSPSPDYVVVTSFNEFHENTHIEPSKQLGDGYLVETRAFKERLVG